MDQKEASGVFLKDAVRVNVVPFQPCKRRPSVPFTLVDDAHLFQQAFGKPALAFAIINLKKGDRKV